MRDLAAGVIGIAMVFIFMGVILWRVPALPLVIISIAVAVLLLYDFVRAVRYGESGSNG
jgi:hypothetical protein